MTRLKRGLASFGAVSAMCFAAAPAHAQSLDDKFWVELSAYWATVDSSVRVDKIDSTRPGTVIDFESDLDLDKRSVLPALTAGARLGDKWLVGVEYYSLSRSATQGVSRELVFDDLAFPASATVSSKFSSDIYRMTVGYSFYRTEDAEVGGAIGLHLTDFSVSLRGDAQVGNNPATQSTARKREALAPLPTLGLFGNIRVAPEVILSARAEYLSLSVGDYDGRLLNAQAAATYRAFKNVGIGLAYRYVDYRIDVEKDDWQGRLKYRFRGPALFLQAGF